MSFENEQLIKEMEAWLDVPDHRPPITGSDRSVTVRPIFQLFYDYLDDGIDVEYGAPRRLPAWSTPQVMCWHGTQDHQPFKHFSPDFAFYDPIEASDD